MRNADLQFAEDKDLERYARDSEVLRDLEEAQLHRAVAAEQEQQVGAASSQPECMHKASISATLLCMFMTAIMMATPLHLAASAAGQGQGMPDAASSRHAALERGGDGITVRAGMQVEPAV